MDYWHGVYIWSFLEGLGEMTAKGCRDVCNWLRRLTKDLQNHPESFAKTLRARYYYPLNKHG